jgi:AcrR family transcriptional regulator
LTLKYLCSKNMTGGHILTIVFIFINIIAGKKVVVGLLERRGKEKDSRKKLILKSARALFFKKGYNKVTVDEIAKTSELGKGSIYLYFRSKEEIYAQILLNDIDNFNQQISVLSDRKNSASDLLVEFSCIYVDFFLNDSELFRILMTYMLQPAKMNLSEKLNSQILGANARSIDAIGKILQLGVESKEFPADINLKRNQNAIWGLLNGIISLYIFSGAQVKRRERIYSTIKLALELFIRGLKKA